LPTDFCVGDQCERITDKSTYKCDSCKKFTGDTTNEHYIAKSNQKEASSTKSVHSASRISGNDSLSMQLEPVCVNGISTMEMVKSLVVMVPKLSSEVQQPRNDNETEDAVTRPITGALSCATNAM
jgi:hypothetical protein